MKTTLEFDKASTDALTELQNATGLNASQCVGYGISILIRAIRERSKGKILALVDEKSRAYWQIDFPKAKQIIDVPKARQVRKVAAA